MSGLKDPLDYRFRGVYGVYDDAGELMYVGSTTLGLKNLEENHRKAREKGYDMTNFRTLLEKHESWKFVWFIKPHNVDKTPYKSSIYYGRYADVLELYGEELEYLNG